MQFRMNSPQGKAILALVRNGDYAHPGEETAIELVAGMIPTGADRRILDVGCGRGGTAAWFQRHGWGEVVGVDLDAASIDYARRTYPDVAFHACDVGALAGLGLAAFDLAYLFNSFYAFADQRGALGEIRRVCRDGAQLMIFDYTMPQGAEPPPELGGEIGRPIVIDEVKAAMRAQGWNPVAVTDFTDRYVAWYDDLLNRFRANEAAILAMSARDWYEYVVSWYGALRDALAQRRLGGAVILATATKDA
jgi:ubiquinone/menaquinone biosynthesis C-methylase UbiE